MKCKTCQVEKDIEAFRVTQSHGRPWRSSKCRSCELARQKELWYAKTEHTCHVCHETKPLSNFAIRTYRCHACHNAQGKNRDPLYRQGERARRNARRGKSYTPRSEAYASQWWVRMGRGVGGAVNLRHHGWRTWARTQGQKWIDRLRVEIPHLYDPNLAPATLEYRAQYDLDPEFRAAQIRRAHKRRSDEEHGLFFDDGTLTGPAICRLFAQAKRCPYCDTPMPSEGKTLDHVWPRCKGGWHSIHNAVVCCYSCNSRKQSNSPRKWLSRLPTDQRRSVLRLWQKVGVNIDQGYLVAA
jgi:hypothetical protein